MGALIRLLAIYIFSVCCYAQELSLEEELFEFRNNIRSLQQRMDALNNRYLNLSTKLDGILIPRDEVNEILNQELTDSNIKPSVSELENNHSHSSNALPDQDLHFVSTKNNILNFNYGICFPHDTAFANYELEYDTGQFLGITYTRHYDLFFWGTDFRAKFFESKKMSNIPYVGELPARGDNYSINFSLLAGLRYELSEKFFAQGSLGTGVNFSWDEISIASSSYQINNSSIYGSLKLGLGMKLSDYISLLLFYDLDAHGSSGRIQNRIYSQLGLSLGIHY